MQIFSRNMCDIQTGGPIPLFRIGDSGESEVMNLTSQKTERRITKYKRLRNVHYKSLQTIHLGVPHYPIYENPHIEGLHISKMTGSISNSYDEISWMTAGDNAQSGSTSLTQTQSLP